MSAEVIVEIVTIFTAFIILILVPFFIADFKSKIAKKNRISIFAPVNSHDDSLSVQLAFEKRSKKIMANLKALEDKRKYERSLLGKIQPKLIESGLKISIPVFVLSCLLFGFISSFIVMALKFGTLAYFVTFLLCTFAFPYILLVNLIAKRKKQFTEQFPNALEMLVRGVKSGMPPQQCFTQIAKEIPGPCGQEFGVMMSEVQAGVPFSQAVYRAYDRMKTPELKFFACVISIQQETGGNLAEIIQNIVSIMRGRVQLQEKAKALSAEAKAQSYVLGALPFLIVGLLSYIDYEYIATLWKTGSGRIVVFFSLLMMSFGLYIMRRLGKIDM